MRPHQLVAQSEWQARLQAIDSSTTRSSDGGCSSGAASSCVWLLYWNTYLTYAPAQPLAPHLVPVGLISYREVSHNQESAHKGFFLKRLPLIRELVEMESDSCHITVAVYAVFIWRQNLKSPSGACNIDVGLAATETNRLTLVWRSFSWTAGWDTKLKEW